VLLRRDERGVLAIGQQSHAWISGQLARAWGNDTFGSFEPNEEVCLGAEQHDIGMAAWDLAPTRNPDTGLPRSFVEMPLDTHIELWSAGPRLLVSQSRYAALLASIHGMRLYEMRDLDKTPEPDASKIRAFLDRQRDFQDELLATLSADRDSVVRNSQLVWTWDFMSLAICLDWPPCTAKGVPTAGDAVDVELAPLEGRIGVTPWPFSSPAVTVRCEGRRLGDRYESDEALAEAFAGAPWERVAFELVPA
jgi:Protein of unknown function (DUF3891)